MQPDKKLIVVTDGPLGNEWARDFLSRKLLEAGLSPSDLIWSALNDLSIMALTDSPVILACGEKSLQELAGERGIDKWQASVLRLPGRTVIPCYPPKRVMADFSLQVWVSLCAQKAAQELRSPTKELTYDFHLNPDLATTMDVLSNIRNTGKPITVDIETGRGQINTLGFAWSETDAIAINVLPDRLSARSYWELWRRIAELLESDQPKILQNFIYEQIWFSRYGIRLTNVIHDTMICQKFLWPELEMGLDAVGRMYTKLPYWKDDNKDWSNIRDWQKHYLYNCKDTAGTYQGYLGQCADLKGRGLANLHDDYLRKLFPVVTEMCSWGIPVAEPQLKRLRDAVLADYDSTLNDLRSCAGARDLNPRSHKQVKSFLAGRGYKIPKKYDSKTKSQKESTDEKALKKLRMLHPDDDSISQLLKLSKLGKIESSYLSMTYDTDLRMRYSLNLHGTETGRMAGYSDPWGNGVNPQTIPGGSKGINVKQIFEAEPGFVFLQCDLKQAESRFVAYDAADLSLIQALEDPLRDIHSEVASEIVTTLGKSPEAEKADKGNWKKRWRQLGKKSGHGANYSMKEATFIDSCIQEMDLVLPTSEADKVLEAYHKLFPGIRRWHARLREELAQTRRLRTPLGRERVFWGRLDDNMFREAYAYRPQSTIPDIVNHLILSLVESRKQGAFDFRLLLQCHDSVLLELPEMFVPAVAEHCLSVEQWHPKIELAGGRLIIPTSIEVGRNLGGLEEWQRKK